MELSKRLKRIDDFFEDLSIEEFDEMLEAAGINEIEPSSSSGMELSLSLNSNMYLNENKLYKAHNYRDGRIKDGYDLFSENYVEAV